MTQQPPLILASASPRRAELLRALGLDFEIRPVDIDESPLRNEDPEGYVLRLAAEKAAAVATDNGTLVLAADTVVVLDGQILGKPADAEESRQMLRRLSGRVHTVLTGVALRAGAEQVADVATTRVSFRTLSSADIDWYADCREPYDKAGSYAMQGLGALFVDRIDGSASNVIGLPVALLDELFDRLGHDLKQRCRRTLREAAD